jgi:hypothetical protein
VNLLVESDNRAETHASAGTALEILGSAAMKVVQGGTGNGRGNSGSSRRRNRITQVFAQAPPAGTSGEWGFNPAMFGD